MSTTERMTSRDLSAIRRIETHIADLAMKLGVSALRVLRNRRAMVRLNDLEDYQLHDIGLTRDDIHRAAHLTGLLDDPFAMLPKGAQQRRRRFAIVPRRF